MSSIVIHTGLGIPNKKFNTKNVRTFLLDIIEVSYKILLEEGSRNAVVRAITLLENNPLFNAGIGSKLQKDGVARMSASIMSNYDGVFNAVINVSNIKNPIEIANKIHTSEFQVLDSNGAEAFAQSLQIPPFNHSKFTVPKLRPFKKSRNGTVGAIAIDEDHIICVGSSTGGIGNEVVGRVGDTPTIAGAYVNSNCGVVTTGVGEHILNLGVACRICNYYDIIPDLNKCIDIVINEGISRKLLFGVVCLDIEENLYVKATSQELYYMFKNKAGIKTQKI